MSRFAVLCVIVAFPLTVGGLVASSGDLPAGATDTAGFVCPLTGEELPCGNCCPLKAEKVFECPLTGETLPCEKCCPLKKADAGTDTDN